MSTAEWVSQTKQRNINICPEITQYVFLTSEHWKVALQVQEEYGAQQGRSCSGSPKAGPSPAQPPNYPSACLALPCLCQGSGTAGRR